MLFRSRPTEIEAVQFTGENANELGAWLSEKSPAGRVEIHATQIATDIWWRSLELMACVTLVPGHWLVWDGRQPWALSDIALRGRYDRIEPYDQGGTLPPGVLAVHNGTGQPERVTDVA